MYYNLGGMFNKASFLKCLVAGVLMAAVLRGEGAARGPQGGEQAQGAAALAYTILFSSNRSGQHDLYRMDANGGQVTNLTNTPGVEEYSPVLSADGAHIAYTRWGEDGIQIYVMGADGSNPLSLTNSIYSNHFPSWAPDGTRLTFTREFTDFEIFTMQADGSQQTNLTNRSGLDRMSEWSPDGTRIAFYSEWDGDAEIYLINPDGSGETRLTDNGAYDFGPSWSPDGTKLLFYSDRDASTYEIYRMDADGSNVVRLTNNTYNDYQPRWSPDGAKIAFYRNLEGNYDIFVMNADGTGEVQLTFEAGDDYQPSWGPPDSSQASFLPLVYNLIAPQPNPLRVVFSQDGLLYTWEEGRGTVQIPAAEAPTGKVAISQDGEHILYEVTESAGSWLSKALYSAGFDGSQATLHADSAFFDARDRFGVEAYLGWMDFTPGGYSFWLNTWLNVEYGGWWNLDLYFNEYLENPGSGVQPQVIYAPGEGGLEYSLSPDGSVIADIRVASIVFRSVETGATLSTFPYEMPITYSEVPFVPKLVWDTEGAADWAVTSIAPQDASVDPISHVWKVYVDGQPAELLDARATGYPLMASTYASPDLQWLAYEDQLPDYGVSVKLHIAQLGGGTDVVISDWAHFLGWSPDSLHFLYQLYQPNTNNLLLGAVGQWSAPVADFGQIYRGYNLPVWVDAQHFLYVTYGNPNSELRLANVDGTWQALSVPGGWVWFAASRP